MNHISLVALLVVVTILTVVQVPLDVRVHRLSRSATTRTTFAAAVVIAIDASVARAFMSAVVAVIVSLAALGVYWVLHCVSPQSLGWGDVLLVVPLTLAVAYVAVELVLWWQLVAATTGAVHAVWVRLRSGGSHVPFGPHLLVSAWLVWVTSV